ncbi:aminotransferase class I/II-fold pyridoxal phosphate-dependent enzyme [Butyrivibrio sp. INlla14]|uniref:aminotransferase class I/II-fold pyridoxal phosphate-dependent enzyme n=1 Tax=Butyrivibrio sp. INlla14 TaxID=1520808 RepID=UPI000875F376|nr:aminotransferase class I/II-fold pyridoxal phosphate-dependent enzyme [Butyrivibrio sp. INlla14]SCY68603.1 Arginine/lysine/ornithine decarboxylase [Butyrivibrio sp. INlla14]
MPDLYQELCKLADSDMYPFHMPGHKRNLESTPMKGAFRCDITEIDDYDNLHDASGIILEAEKRANRLYGSEETFFLVNGSTCGVLSAISAVAGEGDTVLAARGSHKSFYHAVYMRNLKIKYLPYKLDQNYGIPTGYTAKEIEDNLEAGIKCVFITSPTYEGKCSEIREIAKVCHRRGIPLIVDAAHGAHFVLNNRADKKVLDDSTVTQDTASAIDYTNNLYDDIPESAVAQGADLVIHSVHKTLPSMTQTALLHVQGNLVDRNRLKRFLRIYQSSSPSYVLMSSIDLCVKEITDNGKSFANRLLQLRNKIQTATRNCRYIIVPGKNAIEDAAKVLIYVNIGTMTGQDLYDILRKEYHLQLEMAGDRYALAIISGWDADNGVNRLIRAILDIDNKLQQSIGTLEDSHNNSSDEQNGVSSNEKIYELPCAFSSIRSAWDADSEVVELQEAEGRVSAEFINLYPPGIPLIAPGEIFNRAIIDEVCHYLDNCMNVQGIVCIGDNDMESQDIIRKGVLCVKQK